MRDMSPMSKFNTVSGPWVNFFFTFLVLQEETNYLLSGDEYSKRHPCEPAPGRCLQGYDVPILGIGGTYQMVRSAGGSYWLWNPVSVGRPAFGWQKLGL